MELAPGTRLGQYEILAPLGAGGMGEVYQARDGRLGRDVAIKVLSGGVIGDAGRVARFEREARILASLNHPGIAAVYGFEEHEGTPFIVMELVPGETLAERMGSGGVPIEEALQIARQIADALESAHERGVVHRDLKPGNIKVTPEGRAKVLDLGLAKAFDVKSSDDMSQSPTMVLEQTRPGVILGTAEFMSPEQARGKSVDKRTDIWAFGCVVYEMLAGRRAFTGETITDVLATILNAEPAWDALPAATPLRVRELLRRCLQKDPNLRLRDIGEARIAIETAASELASGERRAPDLPRSRTPLIAAVAAAAIAVAVLWAWSARRGAVPASQLKPPTGRYLAVLFTDLSGLPRAQMYCDGLAATVRARLERFPSVQVTPPSSDTPLAPADEELRQIAKGLGATLLLRGTVQRLGEEVRVTYSMLEVVTGHQIAGGTVDGAAADLFRIQDQLAERVRIALDLRDEPSGTWGTALAAIEPAAARESYAEALGFLERYDKESSVDAAIEILERLSQQGSSSALVQAALARAYLYKYTLTQVTSWADRGMKAIDRAVAIDRTLPEVHATRGEILLKTGQPAEARDEFQKATEANPRSVDAVLGLARAYAGVGLDSEAERTFQRAIALQPLAWSVYNAAGSFYFRQGNYAAASRMFEKVVALMPDSTRGLNNLGAVYTQMGRQEAARQAYARSAAIKPNDGAYSNLGTLEYFEGRYADAAKAFESAARLTPSKALYWANLGDALRWATESRALATEAYRTAIRLAEGQLAVNPRDGALHTTLAICYAKTGDLPKAREHIRRALDLEPNNPDTFLQAAVVANLDNRTEEALRLIRRAVTSGFEAEQVRRDPEFRNLRDLPAFREALSPKAAA